MTSAYRSSTATPTRRQSGGGDRDDLLGQHVERVARHDRRLDRALAHPPGDHRALEQVGAELREDPPAADVADVVAGAADPLQSAGDRLGRLDLDDEVDGAHVDAELQRGGRDQAGQLAGLQHLLDDQALLAGERAVVGAGDLRRPLAASFSARGASRSSRSARRLLTNRIVERCSLISSQQLGVDRRPDRAPGRLAAREARSTSAPSGSRRVGRRRPARPSTRPARGSSGRAACARRCRRRGRCAGPTMKRPTSSSGFCVADRPIRWTSAPAAPREPLERQREVGPALGRRDRVDLVDDAPAGRGEQLLAPRRSASGTATRAS